MRRVLVVLALLGLATSAARAEDPREVTTEVFTLENGLRVVIRRIPDALGSFAQVLYTIGEQDDPPGMSGLAQVMAAAYAEGAAGDLLAAGAHAVGPEYDGRHEYQVRDDHTLFCEASPPDRFRLVLREVAARMAGDRVSEADFERVVSLLSRFPSETGVHGVAARLAASERLHPFEAGGRRGGIPEQIRSLRPETVSERRRRFYKPANAILVVTGNVDSALVRAGVNRQFGPIPPGERMSATPVTATAVAEVVVLRSRPGDWRLPRRGDEARQVAEALAGRGAPPRHFASLALHVPLDAGGQVAAALLVRRLQRLERRATGDVLRSFDLLMELASTGEGVDHRPEESPQVLAITTVSEETDDAKLVESLRERLRTAAASPLDERDRWFLQRLAERYDDPDGYPCHVGEILARRLQLGLDGAAVQRAAESLTSDDVRALAAGPTAAAVVIPRSNR